jgi:hypothetical protein
LEKVDSRQFKVESKKKQGVADVSSLRTWGAAVLRPYEEGGLRGFGQARHKRKLENGNQKIERAKNSSLAEGFFDLGGDFDGEGVEALRQIFNILQELVVENHRGDGGEEAGGRGQQSFGDAGGDGAKAGGAGVTEAGEGVNDAPDSAEESDKGSDGTGGGEPGHALFDAANFFGAGDLHVGGDGLKAFQFGRMRIGGLAADLALQLAIAGGVDRGERRAGGSERLRIRNSSRGAEDAEELVALTSDATEHSGFLQNHSPGDDRKNEQEDENSAGHPAGVGQDAAEID